MFSSLKTRLLPLSASPHPRPALYWRLLSIFYDFWPSLALWMVIGLLFTLGYYFSGHSANQNIQPFSVLQIISWLLCWLVTGFYMVLSWRYGGQSLGMRPWRLKLLSIDGNTPSIKALWIRYLVGTLSLLCGGLGFWWSLWNKQGLTWHDQFSRTYLVRLPKK